MVNVNLEELIKAGLSLYAILATKEDGTKEIFGGGNPETEKKQELFGSMTAALAHMNDSHNLGFAKMQRYISVEIVPFVGETYGPAIKVYELTWKEKS